MTAPGGLPRIQHLVGGELVDPVDGGWMEDIEPATGELLGNFPQAYTHVGLINAAATIGDLLAARDGGVRAWT